MLSIVEVVVNGFEDFDLGGFFFFCPYQDV
jgi:hypothetical protein